MIIRTLAATLAAAASIAAVQTSAPRGHSITSHIANRTAWLGVGVEDLTPARAKALKLKNEMGVEIRLVEENSPAAKAALKENDVVLELNGQKIGGREKFVRLIGESTPGAKLDLLIWRDGSKHKVVATLASRPATYFAYTTDSGGVVTPMVPLPPNPFPPEVLDGSAFQSMMAQSPLIGIEGEALAGQLAEFFGVKEGVLVRSVAANSPAAKAGLRAGDVVIKVSGTPVANTRELSGIMRALHKTVTFTVVRNHRTITLNIEVAEVRPLLVPRHEVL